jgi:hypothetical protein
VDGRPSAAAKKQIATLPPRKTEKQADGSPAGGSDDVAAREPLLRLTALEKPRLRAVSVFEIFVLSLANSAVN